MTEKLYYTDPFLREFRGRVLHCEKGKNGWETVLDRTTFYPEGGGQPADHGTLGGATVLDVHEKDGAVVHLCDRPLEAGEEVSGTIDWARRFDFMQQHSGEHIVSGILCGKFGCDNVGFHIGHDLVTIDFNTELTAEDVREVERLANEYIWTDQPIDVAWPSSEALEAMTYRSKKALTGPVRIVTWPGADRCACCGTHVRSSGQIGLVKLISCQRFREGIRIEMAAGGRALQWCGTVAGQNTLVSQLLSAKPDATAAAVERLLGEVSALRSRAAELEERDIARTAEEYTGAGDVLHFCGPMSAESLRRLCGAVQERCGGQCAVFSGANGVYQYAVSRPAGGLRAFAKALNGTLAGRGGGKEEFIQGSVKAEEQEIRAFFFQE